MLNYVERAEELASSFFYPQLQRSLFYPPTKGLRDWRNQMSRPDLTLFELVAGDLLTELGYARATKGGNLRMRLIAAQWRWAFRVRHSYGFPHLARRTLRKLARWAWPNRRFTAAARAEG